MKLKPIHYAEIVLIALGIFLVIDSLFLHLLSFAYPEAIAWLDAAIDHWMIGLALIAIGGLGLKKALGF
jgi:hypothetical protein